MSLQLPPLHRPQQAFATRGAFASAVRASALHGDGDAQDLEDVQAFDVVLRFAPDSATGLTHHGAASAALRVGHDGPLPVLQLPVGDETLRSVQTMLAGAQEGATGFAAPGHLLNCLSKALSAAGVAPENLDQSVENMMRLALVASLFNLPSATEREKRSAAQALPKWRLARIFNYIEANIGEQITLADLAAAAGMSRMYFASQFRAATGQRPHSYVQRRRIARAQDLLVTTSNSLVEIALGVGFQSQSHFSVIFRKIVGDTPYRWRRTHRTAA